MQMGRMADQNLKPPPTPQISSSPDLWNTPSPKTMPSSSLFMIPHLTGLGGPASFQSRLAEGLRRRGVPVRFDLQAAGKGDSVLVVGGTTRLGMLLAARRRGARLVQRLNGMNWIHRRQPTGLRHFLRSEINNTLLAAIRRSLAHAILYQSHFSQSWWERVYGPLQKPTTVAYNGVDLNTFTPAGPEQPPGDIFRLLLVEGHLGGGNEQGLENATGLAERLIRDHGLAVELLIAGDAPASLRRRYAGRLPGCLSWAGIVPRPQIPTLDRSAHLLFSADLNAACPNSVVEALACGLPVVAFDTGALGELVQGGAGEVVPYGSDHWQLQPPDLDGLAAAAARIIAGNARYRLAARARAEAALSLEGMVQAYLDFLM